MRRGFVQASSIDPRQRPEAAGRGFDIFVIPAAAYLAAALVVGGSSTMLVPGAALELAALPLLAVAAMRLAYRGVRPAARWPLLLAGLALLVPLLQLIPLAPGLWATIPGHEVVGATLDLARVERQAMPASLSPDATWSALFGLAPPLALFSATLTLPDRERRILAGVVAVLALASIGLIVFQRFGGEGRTLFGILDLGATNGAAGFFANRNHQATLLTVAAPLAVLVLTGMRSEDWRLPAAATLAVALMLIVGAIVTTSRAAFILGPLAAVLGLGVALRQRTRRPTPWLAAAPLAALVGGLALVIALAVATKVAPVAARFDGAAAGELRLSLFPIVGRAGLDYAPFGAGLGAFPTIYQAYEPAALVGPAFVNHAHNEFLELWLEAGVPGLVLLAAFVGWLGWVALRRDPASRTAEQATAATGLAVVVLILIHSMIDYPLRTPAMAAVFGVACAMMVPNKARPDPGGRSFALRAAGVAVVVVPLIGVLGWVCFTHAVSSYYDQQDPARALRWNAHNPQALANLAELDFGRSAANPQARRSAEAASRRVLAVAPLNAGSYRRLGLLAEAGNRPREARALMLSAARWSRRDELTQVWLMLDGLKRADFDGALMRADLVLRQWWQLESVVFPVLKEDLGDPRLRAATVRMMARSPSWRPGFLRALAYDDATIAAAREIEDGLRATHAPPTAEEATTLVTALVGRGFFAEARDEWSKAAGVSPPAGIYDGDFRGRPGGAPFNWRFGATTAPLVLDDGAPALAARPSDQEGGLLAEQVFGLPPGSYLLKVDARAAGDAGAATAFEWRLTCLRHEPGDLARLSVAGLSSTWRRLSMRFVVEPGCAGQRLQLNSVGPQGGDGAYFRSIVAEAAPAPP